MLRILIQILFEVISSLLIDELSSRVRNRIESLNHRRFGGTGSVTRALQRRVQRRLLNRMRTEIERDP